MEIMVQVLGYSKVNIFFALFNDLGVQIQKYYFYKTNVGLRLSRKPVF